MKTTLIIILISILCFSCSKEKYYLSSENYFNQGLANYYNAYYSSSIEKFNKAIIVNPYFAEAYNYRGLSFFYRDSEDDNEKAIEDFEKAIELNPSYIDAFNNKGYVYKYLENYDKAIIDFKKVLDLDSSYKEAYIDLGDIYNNLDSNLKAIQYYTKAIELDTSNCSVINSRALVYVELNNIECACRDFKKSASLKNDFAKEFLKKHCLNPPVVSDSV